jgi:hypothetical protein
VTLFGLGKKSKDAEASPLSKQDYARTTGDSPTSTSMISPIKDDAHGDDAGEPTESIAPVVAMPPSAASPASGRYPQPPQAVSKPPVRSGRTVLRVVRIDPYSITRLAFVVSVSLMIVTTVAVAAFWLVLYATGFWGEINQAIASLLSDDTASFDITDYLGFNRVVGGTLLVAGINVILMTALATVGAHLFNLAAALLGGVEATVTED